ncbi:MAG: hypothetical protein FWF73_00095 [Spirochaetes bacterium]|nr:hypothetical protein [Spirochaetota bacterium]
MKEVINHECFGQEKNIIPVEVSHDEIITRDDNKTEVEDFKQAEWDDVNEDKMNAELPTSKTGMKKIKDKTFKCFFYNPLLSPKKYNWLIKKVEKNGFSDIEKSADINGDLKSLCDRNKLYYKDSLTPEFSVFNKEKRKKLIEDAEKNVRKEYENSKKSGYISLGSDSDGIKPYAARYLYKNWLPKFRLVVIENDGPLSLIYEDTLKYYIKTAEEKTEVADMIRFTHYGYKLPSTYTFKRTYYKDVDLRPNIIATQGCLITCYADIITYDGRYGKTTPRDVKNRMQDMDEAYNNDPRMNERGFNDGTADMRNYAVAKTYSLKFKIIAEDTTDEDKGKKDERIEVDYSEIFRDEIEKRIKENKPTIAKLIQGESTHFVIVVGLRYDINGEPVAYIINDPGRKNEFKNDCYGKRTQELNRFIIDCKSRIYKYNDNKKMVRISSLDPI